MSRLPLCLCLLLFGCLPVRALEVVINEFLASNQAGLTDEDGSRPDWIELLNVTDQPVSLAGWHLTDDASFFPKWTFPEIVLEPGAFLVVFASDKNRAPTNGFLHANFRLNADGEYLALVRPDLEVEHAFSPAFPEQLPDVSFGLQPGFATLGQTRYFLPPSPGAVNDLSDASWLGQMPPVSFSLPRGFHTNAISIALACADPLATIRYTLDGSVPSSTNGLVYAGAIPLDRSDTLRAAAVRDGFLDSAVRTHTHLFPAEAGGQTFQDSLDAGFPETWNGFPADYGMDPDVVGPADLFGGRYAGTIAEDLLSIPSVCLSLPVDDLFGGQGIYANPTQTGPSWERACSLEFLEPGVSGLVFQASAGLRILGGSSRSFGVARKKSFRLVFEERFGGKRLLAPLFGEGAANSFDTLVLRMESNDGYSFRDVPSVQYTRDTFARELHRRMGHPAARSRPVHLYLNGRYWGVYNLGERPDDEFAVDYLGGRAEDYDVISSGNPPDASNVVNGDGDPVRVARTLGAWSNLVAATSAVTNAPDEDARTAAYFAALGRHPDGSRDPARPIHLNAESYADYLILNHWLGNRDWPWQNFFAARLQGPAGTGWTFLSWDAEWTLGSATPTNENRIADARGCALPFQHLRASAEFRQFFADRIHRHFRPGGVLHVDPDQPGFTPGQPGRNFPSWLYAGVSEPFARPLVAESARWGDQWAATPYTVDAEWRAEQFRLTNGYLRVRSAIVLDQYRAAGLLPPTEAPAASPAGHEYEAGARVVLSAPAGAVYYSLNGPDPRLIGGGEAPEAVLATGPIPLSGLVHLRARALDNGIWSPLLEEVYVPRLRLVLARAPSGLLLAWNPLQDIPHTVECAHDLTAPVWSPVATVATNGPGRLLVSPSAGPPGRIYRVVR